MARKKIKGPEIPMTTAQALGSVIKSARDIMRKDKGLNGDLDRLPLLTWIMFLKFLDDLEQQREQEELTSKEEISPCHRGTLQMARLGGGPTRRYGRRASFLHQSRRNSAARRKEGAGAFCIFARLVEC